MNNEKADKIVGIFNRSLVFSGIAVCAFLTHDIYLEKKIGTEEYIKRKGWDKEWRESADSLKTKKLESIDPTYE